MSSHALPSQWQPQLTGPTVEQRVQSETPTQSESNITDGTIVAQVLAGDSDRYRLLVDRYQGPIQAFIGSLIFSREETEDLVQQSFVNAYQKLGSFDQQLPFLPWLKIIARNLAIDHLRKVGRRRHWLDDYRLHILQQSHAIRDGDGYNEDARFHALEACLARLPSESLEALRLRYGLELNMDEIGEQIGRSAGATQRFLSRIRAILKDCIDEKLEGLTQ